jgi:hypothetical protein
MKLVSYYDVVAVEGRSGSVGASPFKPSRCFQDHSPFAALAHGD